MHYDVNPIFSVKVEHGEGPVWDPVHQQFYWVDLLQGLFFIGDWEGEVVECHTVNQPLGVLALRESGGVVMALRDGFFFYDPNTRKLELKEATEIEVIETRFNDGAVDPHGRFWAVTMTYDGKEPIGNLYRLDGDYLVHTMQTDVKLGNGMGWSPDKKLYYFTDTERNKIYVYDYDNETGSITNRRDFINFGPGVFPDGLTVDAEGGLWVAMWGQGKLRHFNSQGKLLALIELPVTYPTSCCFAGPDLQHLMITTSMRDLSPEQRKAEPLAGRCFVVETLTTGQIEPRYAG